MKLLFSSLANNSTRVTLFCKSATTSFNESPKPTDPTMRFSTSYSSVAAKMDIISNCVKLTQEQICLPTRKYLLWTSTPTESWVRTKNFNHLLRTKNLFHQFLVDMYAKIEGERLRYVRHNQSKLRVDSYIHLKDALAQDSQDTDLGRAVILPSSFTGGPRYMHEKTQDAMTYVGKYGRPDLFITFTCNPSWPEIKKK